MAFLMRIFFAIACVIATGLHAPKAAAEPIALQESQIKAGLLYNFLKYTKWPDMAAAGPIQVCVLGKDPFDGYLSSLEQLTVQRRAVSVRYISEAAKAASCQMVFVSAESRGEWNEVFALSVSHHILTVADYSGFAEKGGMFEFDKVGQRIQVKLNVGAAVAAGLHVEKRLMGLVTIVERPPASATEEEAR